MIWYYKIVPAADAPAAMAEEGSLTSEPRLSIDETQALVTYSTNEDDRISQEETLTIMASLAWTPDNPTP